MDKSYNTNVEQLAGAYHNSVKTLNVNKRYQETDTIFLPFSPTLMNTLFVMY